MATASIGPFVRGLDRTSVNDRALPAGRLAVQVLFNPSSGTGRRNSQLERLLRSLHDAGHEVMARRVGEQAPESSDVMVIAGGDGTLHHALSEAVESGTPVYHVPFGTENLFARQFGMNQSPAMLGAALGRRRTVAVDLGECNGRYFVVMGSVGPDASVIHRLDQTRTGPISHLSYVRPVLEELVEGGRPRMSVWVNGQKVVDEREGMLVVANSRQYAMRIDPCPDACMHDGRLDMVFVPATFNLSLLGWFAMSRLRSAEGRPGLVRASAGEITVQTDGPVQLDGEGVKPERRGDGRLSFKSRSRALHVLVP